jgi:phage antirepressor YoqD-like protein
MSSREIAELTGKQHQDVLRDIRVMLDQLELGASSFAGSYLSAQNKTLPCFKLPKDLSITLVSGYSVPMRHRIVTRWMELEGQQQIQVPALPRTYKEALLALVAAEEEKEALAAQVRVLEPKAQFHDAVVAAVNDQTVQEVAKVLGTGQNRLFAFLRDAGLLMHDNLPYQRHVDAGHFRVVERTFEDRRGESRTYTRTLVTGKGIALIQKRLAEQAAAEYPLAPSRKPRHGPAMGFHGA